MDKQRLDWVMSGLNQYALTKAEDHFLKVVSADFDKNQAITEHQEERLELFYRQKSQLAPNKSRFLLKGSDPPKARPRRPTRKFY